MKNDPLKFFLIAGEPSGDIHGANLIAEIRKIEPNSSFMGHGGDKMKDAGMKLIHHINVLSVMGFLEVLKYLPRFLKIMGETIKAIERSQPDRVILIDYPGFNLRLAKNISFLNIPISYFILPQSWAWKEKRVEILKKYIDQSISIFSFEQGWYKNKGLDTDYVGHPFADINHLDESSEEYYKRHDLNISKPILVLLPGSRQQEINRHWSIILDATYKLLSINEDIQVIIGKSKNVFLEPIPDNFKIEENSKKAIISATAAITCSGTATLECAVEDTPMVVCYKLSTISWYIAKILSKVKYSSIVNLILNKEVVPELLQNKMNSKNIVDKIIPLLDSKSFKRKKMLSNFSEIRKTLGIPGFYERAASLIISKTKIFDNHK
tara:strand:+ start:2371 stop:3510 length:1140 start_codon:yes stop_codon:yes gene_type:complete